MCNWENNRFGEFVKSEEITKALKIVQNGTGMAQR